MNLKLLNHDLFKTGAIYLTNLTAINIDKVLYEIKCRECGIELWLTEKEFLDMEYKRKELYSCEEMIMENIK